MPGKIIAGIVLSCAALGILFFLAVFFYSPEIAEKKSITIVNTLGFDESALPPSQKSLNEVAYLDIALDKDKISTIKTFVTQYNPVAILLSGRLRAVTFNELNLIGEWSPAQNPPVAFSGWLLRAIPDLSNIPADNLRFANSKLSVLTPDMGGLSLSFDLQGALESGKLEFQSRLKSAQKYISFTGIADGVISSDHFNIDIEMEQGKFEFPKADIRASRVSGTISLSREKSGAMKSTSEIRAGGLTLLGLPWQNASIAFDITDGIANIDIEAKSTGIDDIELSLNIQKNAGAPTITGSIHADDGNAMAAYLAQQKNFTLPAGDTNALKKLKNVKIDFIVEERVDSGKIMSYRLDENSPMKEMPLNNQG